MFSSFGLPSTLLEACFVCSFVVKSVAQCRTAPRPDSLSSILHPRSSVSVLVAAPAALDLCGEYSFTANPEEPFFGLSFCLRHFLAQRVKKTSRERLAVQLHCPLRLDPCFRISFLFI